MASQHIMTIHMRNGEKVVVGVDVGDSQLPGYAENIGLRGWYRDYDVGGVPGHEYYPPSGVDKITFANIEPPA